MPWKRNVKNEMIILLHVVKEKQVFGKKLATSLNGEKPATSTQNQNKRKKYTFENNSKNAKMQCAAKMKFEIGTWGRTKNMKMKEKFIFKGKMHILRQIFSQMASIQQFHA